MRGTSVLHTLRITFPNLRTVIPARELMLPVGLNADGPAPTHRRVVLATILSFRMGAVNDASRVEGRQAASRIAPVRRFVSVSPYNCSVNQYRFNSDSIGGSLSFKYRDVNVIHSGRT